ncbi:flavin reductase (DIM6/NTAB) family NADH-FMN oxidoreductase RutF [Thermocatellispora tengchongensis]|uniref:Flavin reductase (DIM6/NTAB) family NADH-FMN oxidoreductase RutF n=1 Tax=Thermocatellispora tengchongensis TaxID=1073253 RepID=A0A840P822_9ACTN|nr:flavin reductase family protein [Thermocatellispora tengchongensis]MBB5135442.1 flavin reductase (DIM6/NTAB) family NADH-FMN oxidoreductase RutF [Thermocatellispora tengchongensis]
MAVTADEFRRFMAQWPSGVAVVTTANRGVPAGCTVNAVMSLSAAPPLLVVSLSETSRTLPAIRESGRFGVSLLSRDQRDLCERFAHRPPHERFGDDLAVETRHAIPILAHACAAAVCRAVDYLSYADHTLIVGAPLWQSAHRERSPLVLQARAYHDLASTRSPAICDRPR